jgi:drug/metabolite transporter (DMT)-like permease
MKNKPWLFYTILTTVTWGIWGALMELPVKAGFPSTLGYSVWALTMIPCAVFALRLNQFKLEHDKKSLYFGLIIGFTGSGGTVLLFEVLKLGPAYIIFPIISLSPILTVILSVIFLKEKTSKKSWFGIILALIAIFLLSYSKPDGTEKKGYLWLELTILIFIMWGVQAYYMKLANNSMKAESIFTYMAITAVILIPVTILMTDFHQNINWGFKGPYLTAIIQIMNAIGALSLVYAIRYGKVVIVTPMTSLYPVITIILSLAIYAVIPGPVMIAGIVLAIISIYLFAT